LRDGKAYEIENLTTTTPRTTRMVQLPATAAIEYVAAVNACLIYVISSV